MFNPGAACGGEEAFVVGPRIQGEHMRIGLLDRRPAPLPKRYSGQSARATDRVVVR